MRPIDADPIEQALFKQADKSLTKSPYENARICALKNGGGAQHDRHEIYLLPASCR